MVSPMSDALSSLVALRGMPKATNLVQPLKVQGEPAGSELSNNARAIREGAKRVAGFR
jgi:hypothetical protein